MPCSEAFVSLKAAQLFKRVRDDVAVDPSAQLYSRLTKCRHIREPVAEIALRGRTDSCKTGSLPQEPRLVRS